MSPFCLSLLFDFNKKEYKIYYDNDNSYHLL